MCANIQPWQVYVLAGVKRERISSALLEAHRDAWDEHSSEYKYYSTELPEPYLSRRAQFGRIYYGSLGIQQSDTAARTNQTSKNYAFFGAPIGLIVTIDRRLEIGSWLDLGMFIQNVMLAAGARPAFVPAGDVLKIPPDLAPNAFESRAANGGLRHFHRLAS